VNSLEELRQVPQIVRFMDGGCTLQQSTHGNETLVMGWKSDEEFYVLGYLSGELDWLDLPQWKSPKRTEQEVARQQVDAAKRREEYDNACLFGSRPQ